MARYQPINLADKLGKFAEHWAPRVIAEMNEYQFKVVKLQGYFVWHDHKETDEAFIVLSGNMDIEFRDGVVRLAAGEMFVIKKGVEHRTHAHMECHALIIELKGVINTGNAGGSLTAAGDLWL